MHIEVFQPQCDILLMRCSVQMHAYTISYRLDRSMASGPLHILSSDCYVDAMWMRWIT